MLLKVEFYTKPDSKPELLWTNRNSKGEYCLSNDDSVWFTDSPDNKYLDKIDGFPNAKKVTNHVMRLEGKLGIWDSNMHKVAGPFSDWESLKDYLDDNLPVLKNMEDFSYTPKGYSEYAWKQGNRRVRESKSFKLKQLIETLYE